MQGRSQNNLLPTILYAGLDLHKATLQLHRAGNDHVLANDAAGYRRLLRLLAALGPPVQVICEASGGCERGPLAALHAAAIPVRMINPAQVKAFARALGRRARTDPLDAQLLSRYGTALAPAPTPPQRLPPKRGCSRSCATASSSSTSWSPSARRRGR